MNTARCQSLGIFTAAFTFFLVLSGGVEAQDFMNETVTEVRVTSDEFVIASDANNAAAGYDRDTIQIEADVDYVATKPLDSSGTYRMLYQIVDPDGAVQSSAFSPSYNVASPSSATTIRRTETLSMSPTGALQPNLKYTVRATVQQFIQLQLPQWGNESTDEVGDKRFLHFTNTTSNDAGINVLVVVTDTSFNRTAMIAGATDPQFGTFSGEIEVDIYRYDNYAAAPSNTDVDMNFEMSLVDSAGLEPWPLLPPDADRTGVNVISYSKVGALKVPAVKQNLVYSVSFAPAGQLDSVNETYRLSTTVSHVESIGVTRVDGPKSTALAQLLHFNGTLRGGSVVATMADIGAVPTLESTSAGHVVSKLDVDDARIASQPDQELVGAGLTTVRLLPNGDAEIDAGTLNISGPLVDAIADVRFERTSGTLNAGGAQALIAPIFPAGMGYRLKSDVAGKLLIGDLPAKAMTLGADLRPTAANRIYNAPPGEDFMVIEETKPVALETPTIQWNIGTGSFVFNVGDAVFNRETEMAAIDAAPITPAEQVVFSNDGFYEFVTGALAGSTMGVNGSNDSALLLTSIDLGAGDFKPHFPRGVDLSWTGVGAVVIFGDVVVPASSFISGVSLIDLKYSPNCLSGTCQEGSDILVRLNPDGGQLNFTADGGISRVGTLLDTDISWGYIHGAPPKFAHQAKNFGVAFFMMPGTFINETDGHSGTLLHEGVDPGNLSNFERDGDAAYQVGLGDYAGFNYRVGGESIDGISTLGGTVTPAYGLDPASKYYVRAGGVTGIHDAVDAKFPGAMMVYGFPFDFDNFSLSYLDNTNLASRTEGRVSTPAATEINLPFEGLKFGCLGQPEGFSVPNGSVDDNLRYWDAGITISAGRFSPKDGGECNPTEGDLAIGVQTWASHLEDPLHGTLLLSAEGEIVQNSEENSRLGMPPVVVFDGPTDEKYRFDSLSKAYFNNHELADDTSDGAGFLNFSGKVDIPFFDDLRIHGQTKAKATKIDNASALHFTGGWSEGANNFFESAEFDSTHRGRPVGVAIDAYRKSVSYMTKARQELMGVIDLEYSLAWDTSTRSFASPAALPETLFVVSTEHQVRYLSPENVELDFGAKWEGVPTLNIANIGVEFAADSGYFTAVTDAISGEAAAVLKSGLDFGEELLSDRADALFDAAFDAVGMDDLVEDIYASITADGVTELQYEAIMCDYITDLNFNAGFKARLDGLFDTGGVGDPVGLWLAVDGRLAQVQGAIRSLIGRVEIVDGKIDTVSRHLSDPGEVFLDGQASVQTRKGIFYGEFTGSGGVVGGGGGGDRARLPCELGEIDVVVEDYDAIIELIASLLVQIDPDLAVAIEASLAIAGDALADVLVNDLGLGGLLEESRRGIESLRVVLMRIHNLIHEVRSNTDELEGLIAEISIGGADGVDYDFEGLKDELVNLLVGIEIEDFGEIEVKERIRIMLRDSFNASPLVVELQYLLREKIQDLHARFTREVDSAFGKLNRMTFDLLESYLANLDLGLPGLRGGDFDPIKAGKIDGYAHINGDALRHLRLDAEIDFDFGEPFRFAGFFEIRQWDSEGDPYCGELLAPGATRTEVSLGAPSVPADWTGSDLVFDIGTKFSFRGSSGDDGIGTISGVGGYVNLCDGEIEFETMKITGMNAAAAFGADENYVAAALDLDFEGYQLEGGAFFGKTCEIAPLAVINSEVASVLGEPPFTGAYLYGRAHMPIVNGSCVFRLSAGIGAGLFYFIEGPTYGGQLDLSASGEALCLITVRGDLNLIGVKRGRDFTFRGTGRIKGKAGSCPFCVRFKKSVTLSYENGEWDYDY
jgi:hypothetical protein